MPLSLPQIRDLLLPGLWGQKVEVDVLCNFADDSIEIITPGKRETLFTRSEIDDGSFKQQFAPRLKQFLGDDYATSA